MMKTTLKRTMAFVIGAVMFIALTAVNEQCTTTHAYEVIGNYVDDYEYESELDCDFIYGEHMYNYSLLYEYTDEDINEFNNLLLNPENISALHIRKYDSSGDKRLDISDFIQMYKEVNVATGGFYDENGTWYDYDLYPKTQIDEEDIIEVQKLLTKIIKPLAGTGAYTYRYDYSLNGRVDIYDLVLMKKYYSSNPCRFIRDPDGFYIQPDHLVELLDAAEEFGVDNFIIKFAYDIIPYSIMLTDERIYSTTGMYQVKPMQIIPAEDEALNGYEEYLLDDAGGEWSLWRWADSNDTFEDMLWIKKPSDRVYNAWVMGFVIIPLDENGGELGVLLDKNEYISE